MSDFVLWWETGRFVGGLIILGILIAGWAFFVAGVLIAGRVKARRERKRKEKEKEK